MLYILFAITTVVYVGGSSKGDFLCEDKRRHG